MRDVFPGYYPLDESEKADIWVNGLIVLDTNALFNLYRYTQKTRNAFLEVLRLKHDQLWLPHQVGLEFHIGRLGIIRDQQEAFPRLIEKTKSALATVTTEIGSLRNHPSLDLDDLRKAVTEAVNSIAAKIEVTRKTYEAEVVAKDQHGATTDEITLLYEGRVGSSYSAEKLDEIFAAGAQRYDDKVPPGYKDAHKPSPDRYGDLVLWMQVLEKAASDSKSVLFVSDDQKEDWWREFKGEKIGPRVELVEEFKAKAGKRIQFATPQQLLAYANKHGNAVNSEAVREVGDVSFALAQVANEGEKRMDAFLQKYGEEKLSSLLTERRPRKRRAEFDMLERRRAVYEEQLRSAQSTMNRLRDEGKHSSNDYRTLQADVQYLRSKIAELSRAIKRQMFDYLSPNVDERTRDLIDIVRPLLRRSSVPTLGPETSWDEVSDEDIALLLSPAYAELLDPELESLVRRAEFEQAFAERGDRSRIGSATLERDDTERRLR